MRKLEDIPKKDLFKAPDGYFDKLPGIIQTRVANPEPKIMWLPVLKFALPVLALVTIGFFWFSNPTLQSFENELADINTEQLMAYLDNTEVVWEDSEMVEAWDENDLTEFEDRVYSTFTTEGSELDLLDKILDLENL
ncbi:MAG TPA: hypothetical protein PLM56_12125 [Cyclobacteriaceae bacterium]|jgi:hypothetical protein|nr:hypothetical protein [Cytophagales bacterium]HMR57493.1 hypothetical protein [Cyclobacteriaceae bacterium]HNT51719.1 hypothetical protein [Cyclobacteriaceae bacterium]HRE66891.1 hypothetical protein [Cyclobacteriaceae bacterium]HRF34240.1 hypothetical protein [Cyclobacteriaceae bacterium]